MKDHDEEAKKRIEQRHKEMREDFIKNLNTLMYRAAPHRQSPAKSRKKMF